MKYTFDNGSPDLVVASGTPEEIGITIGQDTSDLIAETLELYRARFLNEAKLDESGLTQWGKNYAKVIREYRPRIHDMIRGIAQGASESPEVLFALNARTEILYGTNKPDDACTTAAILPEYTASGSTLLAQNWDWRANLKRSSFVLATEDELGHRVITLAEAGMLAKSGLNSQGIGVCANLLVSDRDTGGEGVPYHFLLRSVLESTNMSDAQISVLNTERISSGNFLIGAAGGEAIDIEAAPGDFGYLLPEDGVITHSNHFLTQLPLRDKFAQRSALTLLRAPRLRKLINRRDAKLTFEHLIESLSDHFSFPDGICRHADPTKPREDQVSTVYTILLDLEQKDFYIAPETVCENSFWKWNLDAIFDDQVVDPVESFPKSELNEGTGAA